MNAFSVTDIGKKRSMNQDYAYASTEPLGKLPNIFLVADGMGGHRAGGYASHCAADTIVEEIQKMQDGEPAEIMVEAIRKANTILKKEADEDEKLSGMGTTIVAATCNGEQLTVANVGDSRLYVVNEAEIRQITQDHSLVEEMVRCGGISREEAKHHPDKNIITRAVGTEDSLEVDCFFVSLHTDDRVLLCSDGLTNMLEDTEIQKIMTGEGTIEEKAGKLVEAANDNGGRDNIAVIILEPFSEEVKE